ncbi:MULTISPECIES: Ig domain-containing protein [unclassified Corallococcus]|uniref:Ig domain-containing protein n=1 Tax=unclassified Corallococcus TaxID=2685029 RepID=UPI001A8C4AE9|nr:MULTISPECIES: Ig domain-containing protein [unclassified Corallococcus]MBN9683173.1 putative Ig domain-containing protein [Corallococcus sp. NCSPR001]WAS85301.1 Ig domain-containing protein [Corallococcus sp. NCRR]
MRKLLAALTGAVVLTMGACTFAPDLSRFAACDAAGGCPSGTSCLPSENRCLPACGEGGPCDDEPEPVEPPDAGMDVDAGTGTDVDAGAEDAGATDEDAGVTDAGGSDAGPAALALEPLLPEAIESTPYSGQLQARGGTPPYTFNATGALPAGILLDTEGRLTGAPKQAGDQVLPVEVTDLSTPTKRASGSLTLHVRPLLRVAGPEPLADAVNNRAYTERVSATGGKRPYTFALAQGQALPAGLTLAADGLITGSTTQAGKTTFTVAVTDSDTPPQSTTGSLSITLTSAPGTITLMSKAVPKGRVGSDYSYTVRTSGTGNWSVKSGALPPGILLDTKDGILSGKPTSPGDFTFSLGVADLLFSDERFYTLHVD